MGKDARRFLCLNNNSCFFILVDAHSKWPEVFTVKNITSENTVETLSALFSRYGLPKLLFSDTGRQFASEIFEKFLKENGIQHFTTAPYCPSTNDQAENMVRTIKKAYLKQCNNKNVKINYNILFKILFDYRNTKDCSTGKSPTELFLGRSLRCRFDPIKPSQV